MASRVGTSRVGDREVLHLFDDSSGASASILPSYGFNLFDLRLPVGGKVEPVVVSDPTFDENPSKPARSGFPILFPFPGRIRDARFEFEGKTYELVPNKAPHAIHGFALDAPWDVVEHDATQDGATVLGRFQTSRNAPGAVGRWPADAILEVRYTLAGSRLSIDVKVTNPDQTPLPWGFGLHSYFRLPFDSRETRHDAGVRVPASGFWVLENGLPTGEIRDVTGTRFDYRDGVAMSEIEADDALTRLDPGIGCRLIDESLGMELVMNYDSIIREIVVFTPQGSRGVVAVEPYTQMADAFALQSLGANSGLQLLDPGASSSFSLSVETKSFKS